MSEARFTRTNSAFAMTCRVEVNIVADAKTVWSLLTDAKGFPRWNSTVSSIEGQIREGERLRLHVPGTNRTFTPTVTGVVPARRMTWSDGLPFVFKGVRTFALEPRDDGSPISRWRSTSPVSCLRSSRGCCRTSVRYLRPTPTT